MSTDGTAWGVQENRLEATQGRASKSKNPTETENKDKIWDRRGDPYKEVYTYHQEAPSVFDEDWEEYMEYCMDLEMFTPGTLGSIHTLIFFILDFF